MTKLSAAVEKEINRRQRSSKLGEKSMHNIENNPLFTPRVTVQEGKI